MKNIVPPIVRQGDTIGIISPCDAKLRERVELGCKELEKLGFKVKTGDNAFNAGWTYAASARERADDFNAMAADDEVKLVFFGGGEVATEILPYIDYALIREKPKRYCSYSDSTSILNAITSMSGIVTYHGQTPRTLEYFHDYNRYNFFSRLLCDDGAYKRSSDWIILKSGKAEGITIGGYTQNICLLLSSPYFKYKKDEKYILFIEDYHWFSCPAAVARYISHIEQSDFFGYVSGVVFGDYSEDDEAPVLEILSRFADRNNIPVAKCKDFGHGSNNAIIPIGMYKTVMFE